MAFYFPRKLYSVRVKVITITDVLDIAYIVHACCVKEKDILSRELFGCTQKNLKLQN